MMEQDELNVAYIPNTLKEALEQEEEESRQQEQHEQKQQAEEDNSPENIEEHKQRFLAHFYSMADQFKQDFQKLDDVENDILTATSQHLHQLKSKHAQFLHERRTT